MAAICSVDDFLSKLTPGFSSFVLFTGSVDPSTGASWCPDCVKAHKPVHDEFKKRGVDFITCEVGERAVWKNPEHILRTDPRFRLTGVPTLMKFQNGKKTKWLVEEDCAVPSMLSMLFEED